MVARGMRRQGPVDRFDEAVGEDLRNPEARSMDTSLLEGLLGGEYVQTGRERGGLRRREDVEEREAHGRDVGKHALTALLALILPAVLPGGAAYGAAGGLAGGLRAMGQRAGGYRIPGSDAPGFVPPAGSVQAGVSSFQPGIGGRFWGSGRTPGMSGRQPTITQGQTLFNRTSDLGNRRLPGSPGPNRPQPPSGPGMPGPAGFQMTGPQRPPTGAGMAAHRGARQPQKPAGIDADEWAIAQQQIAEYGGVQPWMSLEHGAMGTRLGRNWSREPGALPGQSGMSIRDTPMGRPGPTGPHSSSSSHFAANEPGSRAYWNQPVTPARPSQISPNQAMTLGEQSILEEIARTAAGRTPYRGGR